MLHTNTHSFLLLAFIQKLGITTETQKRGKNFLIAKPKNICWYDRVFCQENFLGVLFCKNSYNFVWHSGVNHFKIYNLFISSEPNIRTLTSVMDKSTIFVHKWKAKIYKNLVFYASIGYINPLFITCLSVFVSKLKKSRRQIFSFDFFSLWCLFPHIISLCLKLDPQREVITYVKYLTKWVYSDFKVRICSWRT